MTRAGWRPGRMFLGLMMLVVIAGGAGFLWFIADLTPGVPVPDVKTDAIVVLTGGSERIERGLASLAAGKARKLFVSGVHPGVEAADLTRGSTADPALINCCLVLGHDADNTEGNATETALWLSAEHYRSLRLVTADYHMKRALLEFRRALPPGIVIIPDPVVPAIAGSSGKATWRTTARVVIVEYFKYLAAVARSFADGRSPAAAEPAGGAT